MNSVPASFYEEVAHAFHFWTENVSVGRQLAGRVGTLFSDVFEKSAMRKVVIRNGQLEDNGLDLVYKKLNDVSIRVQSAARNSNLLSYIRIKADDAPYKTNPLLIQALKACSENGVNVELDLCTTNMNKELAECLMSFPVVSGLTLAYKTECTEEFREILQNVLEKKTLIDLGFPKKFQLNVEMTEFIIVLLKQDQLNEVDLPRNSSDLLYAVIDEWKQNSHEMVGKSLVFSDKFDDLLCANLLKELGILVECTDEEMTLIKTYYPMLLA